MKLLVLFVLSLMLFETVSFSQGNPTAYSFFVAGHTYGAPGVNNAGLHPPFVAKFDYIKSRTEIQLGVLTGDIVSPFPNVQDWDEVDANIDYLGLPIYFAAGNHDMENRPLYESRYGSTYFHFVKENDLFVVLDPNLDSWNISGEQLEYLRELIDNQSEQVVNIYVFFHQVLWRENNNQYSYIVTNSNAGRASTINFWTDIEPLFHDLPNQVLMFAGDLGAGSWGTDVVYDNYDNISLVGSGMGGAEGDNFVIVNVQEDKSITYEIICLTDSNLNCLGELTDYQVTPIKERNHKLYPNPVRDILTIELNPVKTTTIQLYDASGQILLEEISEQKYKFKLDVFNLSSGMYILKVVDDLGSSIVQVMKR